MDKRSPDASAVTSTRASNPIEQPHTMASELQRNYLDPLWRFVRARCDDENAAEDLVAETFASAWRSLAEGQKPRETWPWLVGIAKRKLADLWRLRSRKRHERSWATLPKDEKKRIESFTAGQAEEPELSREAKTLLREALSELRPDLQELLVAHHVEGVSLRELARRNGKSESAIESAMARARRALRSAFRRRKGLLR